jgi:hypothetical protein
VGALGIAVCGAAPDLAEDLSRRRVNRTLATNPAGERLDRLDGSGATGSGQPFAMTPDGNNTNFNTSLTQWSSALTAAEQERLKQIKDASGEGFVLPKAVRPAAPKFDMWAKGRRESLTEDGATAKEVDALTPMSAPITACLRIFCSAAWCSLTSRVKASSPRPTPSTARPSWPAPIWPTG